MNIFGTKLVFKFMKQILVRNHECPRCFHTTNPRLKDACKERIMYMQPDCKVILVIGGAEGIGFSIANHMLKNKAKAVAVTGLNACNGKAAVTCMNNAYGKNRAMFVRSDCNCMQQLEETFRVVKETYGTIDVVVNTAAVCNGSKWEREIVTNLIGAIRTSLLTYQYVGKEGGGNGGFLLHVSGLGGVEPFPPTPTLASTWGGVIALARSFGDKSHLNRSGVRVAVLCPGVTNTNFFKNPDQLGMTSTLGQELKSLVQNSKRQQPDVAGMAGVHLLRFAEPGSVWILEGSRLFLYHLPHWEKLSSLESQFL